MQFRIQQQEGGTPEPSLAEMTDKAIKILRRGSNGYFLLVEGERTLFLTRCEVYRSQNQRRITDVRHITYRRLFIPCLIRPNQWSKSSQATEDSYENS